MGGLETSSAAMDRVGVGGEEPVFLAFILRGWDLKKMGVGTDRGVRGEGESESKEKRR